LFKALDKRGQVGVELLGCLKRLQELVVGGVAVFSCWLRQASLG